MSIAAREDYSRVDGETHNHIAMWVHEMYMKGRDPLDSINKQATALGRTASAIKMDVLVACRPGGHGPSIEMSKRRYMNDWKKVAG